MLGPDATSTHTGDLEITVAGTLGQPAGAIRQHLSFAR